MHVSKTAFTLGLLLAASSLSTAHATVMTAGSSLGDNVYLNAGTTGTFNINSLLTPAGTYVAPYQISSASINFLFGDDANDPTLASTFMNRNWLGVTNDSRIFTETYTDEAESASVNIGGQSGSGLTSYYSIASHLDRVVLEYSYYANNCPGYVGACNHQLFEGRSYYYSTTSGYGGNFGISYALNGSNLADLLADGLLGFNLGVTGDLMLRSASLTFDITPNPAVVVNNPPSNGPSSGGSSNVPEPASLALLGLGLTGLGWSRRRAAV